MVRKYPVFCEDTPPLSFIILFYKNVGKDLSKEGGGVFFQKLSEYSMDSMRVFVVVCYYYTLNFKM